MGKIRLNTRTSIVLGVLKNDDAIMLLNSESYSILPLRCWRM